MPDYPLGIDISNNNGHVNMDEVAASGVKFVIAKLTEGVNFYDRYYMSFRTHAKRLGLKWGAYHYALPHLNNPNLEAAWFASNIEGTLEPGDIVALDLEDPKAFGDLSAWALQWCRSVEGLLGVKPLIYSSPAYITERKLKNRPELGEHGLWLASWGIPTPPPAPAPWDLVAIHQYGVGPSGTIPGVSGEIDLNHFNGPIEDFALYGLPGPVVEPDPDPVPPSDGYAIGQGIRDAMNSYGAAPASSEVPSEFWVEAMDTAGRIYRFVRATGITHAYSPNGEA